MADGEILSLDSAGTYCRSEPRRPNSGEGIHREGEDLEISNENSSLVSAVMMVPVS